MTTPLYGVPVAQPGRRYAAPADGSADGSQTEDVFTVEPWAVTEPVLRLDVLARTESVFALSNGHVGVRGNLEEGEPHALPGTYLNSVHEKRPLPYAEAGYGYPESGQTVVDVTNGKIIRLLVDDEPFDVRYGTLHRHERRLDLRAGTLARDVEWTSPADKTVKVTTTRLVSLTHRSVLAIAYEVEPVGAPARVVVQSELVANEDLPPAGDDPRVAAALNAPFDAVEHEVRGTWASLLHRTRASAIGVAAAMDHVVEVVGDDADGVEVAVTSQAQPDWARVTFTAALAPGQRLRVVKLVSYGWSSLRSTPALRDQVAAALTGARHTGWPGLLKDQRAFLDGFWAGADVEIEGDPALQQAVRFALYGVLQAAVRAEERPIGAKGLTGTGYDGHTFWDTETFVLPMLAHTWPPAVADALRWRHATLPKAKERARQLGLAGAAFPWRTITGEECSGYWPAGTAAFHINADVADAVIRYHDAVRDDDFDAGAGLELLVETARLWTSLGHIGRDGCFHVDGVTGPDEYSAVADDNAYTLLMAQRNLRAAAIAATNYRDGAAALGVDAAEVAGWRERADAVVLPFDADLGVHEQSRGFTRHEPWDFAASRGEHPLMLHHPYFELYRRQVCKQADLVLAMHLRGDAFTPQEKAANFAYYEAITVRDSSLSACTQAVLAAEVGCLDLAYDYACEAAFMDLHDLQNNTRDGLHIASLAGAWTALVSGFGGMRDHDGTLIFAPRLPPRITRMSFRIRHRGLYLHVTTDGARATYELVDDGRSIDIVHHGTTLTLHSGEPVTLPVPPLELPPPAVHQPPGRAPRRR
ncbi:glycoside hydrolase family 65 protein [Kineosporia sp. R_H_3]|uniref:glycoside hydrolase family 65 protein n=1 Tax=Kineosporia sp. R_H_3 TaxID=1961848 RepID=UPI000B4A9E92|nr:glycosyl hydrolase family 65 protein [Kineosporia sp. R_H_3]